MYDRLPDSEFLRRVVLGAGIVGLMALGAYLLYQLAIVLLIVFAGMLFAIFLGGLAQLLRSYVRVPRAPALGLVIVLLIALLAGASFLVGPQLAGQLALLSERIPQAIGRVEALFGEYAWIQQVLDAIPGPAELLPAATDVWGQLTEVFTVTFGALAGAIIVLAIGLYGAISPGTYTSGLVRLVPLPQRDRAREVVGSVLRALRWWLVGRVTLMIVIGTLTGVGLWLVGIPSAFALGLITGLLSFIPYIGAIAAAIPALLVAFLVSATHMLYALIVYLLMQGLENYLFTPLVQEHAVSIPPAALLVAQLVMGFLAGFLGVLLATPIAVTVIVLIQLLYVEDVLGDSTVRVLGA